MGDDGEHVGRQSDSLNDDDDGYRRSSAARLAAVAKPTGKTFRRQPGDQGMGDGDLCPVIGHGRMYVLSGGSGKQWCAHQLHDMGCPRDESGNDWVNPLSRKEHEDA